MKVHNKAVELISEVGRSEFFARQGATVRQRNAYVPFSNLVLLAAFMFIFNTA